VAIVTVTFHIALGRISRTTPVLNIPEARCYCGPLLLFTALALTVYKQLAIEPRASMMQWV
jgi:hypothetical protein